VKITDIKQQVKRQDRYSIYIDGKYDFSLSESELMNIGLKIGQEFSSEEFASLKQKAIVDKAYDSSLNLIARRPRSIWETREYLKRKEYSEEVISQVLNMLSNKKYLDDEKFAEAWVNSRRLLKSVGKRRLIQELRAKRVDQEIIDNVLQNDKTDDREVIKDLIAKKRSQTRYQDDQKLMAYLVRQGFNYSDIKESIN